MKTLLLALMFAFSFFAFADDYVVNSDGGIDLTAATSVIVQAGGDGPMLLSTQNTSDIDILSGGNVVLFPQNGNVYVGGDSLQLFTPNGLQFSPSNPAPCDSSRAGSMVYSAGGSGIADQLQVCVKSADDSYAWKNVSF